MILEYSYDNGMKVLDLFKRSALATLSIKTVKEEDKGPKFIMEYTCIEDYSEIIQSKIHKALDASLSERLNLVNILNRFIEKAILGEIKSFTFNFNAVNVRKCQISYASSFSGGETSKPSIEDLIKCLEQLEHIVVDMGIHDQAIPGMFKKEGNGKSKKYTQLTVQEISSGLRKVLTED